MKWKDITNSLSKAAPLLGGLIGGPAGAAIGSIAASALGVEATPDAVSAAIKKDPEAAAKLKAAEMENARELRAMTLQAETARIAAVNETMRAEIVSGDKFTRRWRPLFGYIMAVTWGLIMAALAWTIVAKPDQAPNVVSAMASLGTIWSVALAVVGVSVWSRSNDKAALAGNVRTGFGVLGALGQRIAGGPKAADAPAE